MTSGHTGSARGGRRSQAGLTLVELLIVVVLAGIVGATMVNIFRIQNGVFRRENRTLEVDQNIRAGLDLMQRELRNAGMGDPLQPYADPPGIARADSQAIRFKADFHSTTNPDGAPDGDVLDADEDIEYTWTPADSTLRRRTRGSAGDSGAQPMAEFVTVLRFTYLDAAGDTLAFPIAGAALGSIRRLQIELSGASPDGQATTTLESELVPRNLAY